MDCSVDVPKALRLSEQAGVLTMPVGAMAQRGRVWVVYLGYPDKVGASVWYVADLEVYNNLLGPYLLCRDILTAILHAV